MGKIKHLCHNCGQMTRNIYPYKFLNLCNSCYHKLKGSHRIMIPGNMKFLEPIKRNFRVTICLTEKQNKFYLKRKKDLGMKSSEYFRELLVLDMERDI